MNSFRQHIPAFADVDQPDAIHFTDTATLLSQPVVQRYKDATFSHFCMNGNALMVVNDDGFEWWVVGFVADPSAVDLPAWGGWKYLARFPDGREAVLTTEVISSCGGCLKLRDGTEAVDVRARKASKG